MMRAGLANKVLLVIVLLLALAAVLGFILTGMQGDALSAIIDSTSNTEGQIHATRDSLSDMGDTFGTDGTTDGSTDDGTSDDGEDTSSE